MNIVCAVTFSLCNISNTQLAKLMLHNTFVTDVFQKAKAPYGKGEGFLWIFGQHNKNWLQEYIPVGMCHIILQKSYDDLVLNY